MQLRSHVAVAVVQASGYRNSTPSLETSIYHGCGPKKTKDKKKKKKKNQKTLLIYLHDGNEFHVFERDLEGAKYQFISLTKYYKNS